MFTLIIQEAKAIQCIGCMPLICGKNKGLVLCSGSKATKKFQKHICFLFFCLLYSLYLTSQQFKLRVSYATVHPVDLMGICRAPTVCQARGWRCGGKAVWTVGGDGCITREWRDSTDNGVVGEPEWTEVQKWWTDEGMRKAWRWETAGSDGAATRKSGDQSANLCRSGNGGQWLILETFLLHRGL